MAGFATFVRLAAAFGSMLATGAVGYPALSTRAAAPRIIVAPHITSIDWPSYNNDVASQRFSPLNQIRPQNVAQLHQICAAPIGALPISLQTGPIVVQGTLFATTGSATIAIDAVSCRLRWTNTYTTAFSGSTGNRGAAYAAGRVFRGTVDGHVQALDARSGKLVWDRTLRAGGMAEAIDAAPIVWRGVLYIGSAGGDAGQAGQMWALDQADGRTIWQQQTVPNRGTPLAATWQGATRIAGGATWSSYTFDQTQTALYVATGNAGPDFDDRLRAGSNAYANSVIVLDGMTGALRAAYQLVPRDQHDWDMGATPLLAYTATGISPLAAPTSIARLMAYAAGKDGYLHAIDTRAQREVWKTPVTTVANAQAPIAVGGTHFCPGTEGGVLWNGPALLPALNTLYVNSVDWCTTVALAPTPQPYVPGREWLGSSNAGGMADSGRKFGWVTAVNALSGKVRWTWRSPTPLIGGITATAGGVVFSGDLTGNILAFDAGNGTLLATIATHHPIGGGIISYAVAGKQYIAVAAGHSASQWGTRALPELAVFAL